MTESPNGPGDEPRPEIPRQSGSLKPRAVTEDMNVPSNWGRWGDRDDLGTLNHLSDASRLRGVQAAKTGRTVSMAEPISPVTIAGGGPTAAAMVVVPTPVMQMVSYDAATQAYIDVLLLNAHTITITHIDAFAHCPVDDMIYPGVPREEAVSGGRVLHGSTAVFADGITTRGVLLDLAPGDRLEPNHTVTSADFEEAERRQGVRVESGDALVVRGGWTVAKSIGQPLPGIGLDAISWMNDREISILASDIGDRPPGFDGDLIPVHFVALARLGLPIIDNTRVEEVAETAAELGTWEFLFSLGTIPITGTTGLPVNPLAIF